MSRIILSSIKADVRSDRQHNNTRVEVMNGGLTANLVHGRGSGSTAVASRRR